MLCLPDERAAGAAAGRLEPLAPHCAGFKVDISERGYFPRVDDEELQFVLFRSQEIRWRRHAVPRAWMCCCLTPMRPLHALAGALEA